MIGRTLSHYRITSQLGKGGMGEVYRATDTRLGRDVAIKILPDHFADDPERRARFEREAQTISRLNHPNICTLHDVGREDDISFLVMELAEGEDLAGRLRRGPMSIKDALNVATQIASGLEDAHEKNIIHRDLKPANVQIVRDGTVKLLDFGLARAITEVAGDTDLSQSPTISAGMTQAGVLLGTAAYMSPEQARAQELDRRTDIWSFGCVLYEMLTGRAPFEGQTITDIIAEIMKSEPDWDALPKETPGEVRTLLWRCLQKDPRERLRDIGEARFYLNPQDTPHRVDGGTATTAASSGIRKRFVVAIAVATFMLGATAVRVGLLREDAMPERPVSRFRLSAPDSMLLTAPSDGGNETLSPDGRLLAFVAESDGDRTLWIHSLITGEDHEVPGTLGAQNPFWSPDSRSVAYFTDSNLKTVTVEGGKSRTLCPVLHVNNGGSWGSDGTIIFATGFSTGLSRTTANGGTPQPLTQPDAERNERSHSWPVILPDGRHYLYFAGGKESAIFLGELGSSERRLLFTSPSRVTYTSDGYLLHWVGGNLMAVPFDADRLETTGTPQLVVSDIQNSAYPPASAAVGGVLCYRTGAVGSYYAPTQLVMFNRAGEQLEVIGANIRDPALSPDESQVCGNWRGGLFAWDLWLVDLDDRSRSRFTFGANDYLPVWSPDGSRVVFASTRHGGGYDLYTKAVDGNSAEQPLLVAENRQAPMDWSHDGKWILYEESDPVTKRDLWIVPASGGDPEVYLATDADEYQGQFSFDGKWVAYGSDESGSPEIYVQTFPTGGARWLVSSSGGTQPRWRSDGKELFYLSTDNYIMVVEIKTGTDEFRPGVAKRLFPISLPCCDGVGTDEFVVTRDGQRILAAVRSRLKTSESSMMVMLNWRGNRSESPATAE